MEKQPTSQSCTESSSALDNNVLYTRNDTANTLATSSAARQGFSATASLSSDGFMRPSSTIPMITTDHGLHSTAAFMGYHPSHPPPGYGSIAIPPGMQANFGMTGANFLDNARYSSLLAGDALGRSNRALDGYYSSLLSHIPAYSTHPLPLSYYQPHPSSALSTAGEIPADITQPGSIERYGSFMSSLLSDQDVRPSPSPYHVPQPLLKQERPTSVHVPTPHLPNRLTDGSFPRGYDLSKVASSGLVPSSWSLTTATSPAPVSAELRRCTSAAPTSSFYSYDHSHPGQQEQPQSNVKLSKSHKSSRRSSHGNDDQVDESKDSQTHPYESGATTSSSNTKKSSTDGVGAAKSASRSRSVERAFEVPRSMRHSKGNSCERHAPIDTSAAMSSKATACSNKKARSVKRNSADSTVATQRMSATPPVPPPATVATGDAGSAVRQQDVIVLDIDVTRKVKAEKIAEDAAVADSTSRDSEDVTEEDIQGSQDDEQMRGYACDTSSSTSTKISVNVDDSSNATDNDGSNASDVCTTTNSAQPLHIGVDTNGLVAKVEKVSPTTTTTEDNAQNAVTASSSSSSSFIADENSGSQLTVKRETVKREDISPSESLQPPPHDTPSPSPSSHSDCTQCLQGGRGADGITAPSAIEHTEILERPAAPLQMLSTPVLLTQQQAADITGLLPGWDGHHQLSQQALAAAMADPTFAEQLARYQQQHVLHYPPMATANPASGLPPTQGVGGGGSTSGVRLNVVGGGDADRLDGTSHVVPKRAAVKLLRDERTKDNPITGSNIPIGIAVARQRQDNKNSEAGTSNVSGLSAAITNGNNNGSSNIAANRSLSTTISNTTTNLTTSVTSTATTSSISPLPLVVNGATPVMLSHNSDGYYIPSKQSEILGTHQLPVGGFKLAQDPATRQLFIIPDTPVGQIIAPPVVLQENTSIHPPPPTASTKTATDSVETTSGVSTATGQVHTSSSTTPHLLSTNASSHASQIHPREGGVLSPVSGVSTIASDTPSSVVTAVHTTSTSSSVTSCQGSSSQPVATPCHNVYCKKAKASSVQSRATSPIAHLDSSRAPRATRNCKSVFVQTVATSTCTACCQTDAVTDIATTTCARCNAHDVDNNRRSPSIDMSDTKYPIPILPRITTNDNDTDDTHSRSLSPPSIGPVEPLTTYQHTEEKSSEQSNVTPPPLPSQMPSNLREDYLGSVDSREAGVGTSFASTSVGVGGSKTCPLDCHILSFLESKHCERSDVNMLSSSYMALSEESSFCDAVSVFMDFLEQQLITRSIDIQQILQQCMGESKELEKVYTSAHSSAKSTKGKVVDRLRKETKSVQRVKSNKSCGVSPSKPSSNDMNAVQATKMSNKDETSIFSTPCSPFPSIAAATSAALKSKKKSYDVINENPVKKRNSPKRKRLSSESSKHSSESCLVSPTKSDDGLESSTQAGHSTPKSSLTDEWSLRRSERIFLNEANPSNKLDTRTSKNPEAAHDHESVSTTKQRKIVSNNSSSSGGGGGHQREVESGTDDSSLDSCESDACDDVDGENEKRSKHVADGGDAADADDADDDDDDDGDGDVDRQQCGDDCDDDLPLSELRKQTYQPHPDLPECSLREDLLHDGLKVLVSYEGLFHEAVVEPLQPPDIYSLHIQGIRGSRPHIYALQELLTQAVLDVQPPNKECLLEGTRVCAYWSQQLKCLYPGVISCGDDDDEENQADQDDNIVEVEFDDGDSGRITIDQLRLIPQDFVVKDTEANPLLLLGRRSSSIRTLDKPQQSSVVVDDMGRKRKVALTSLKPLAASKQSNSGAVGGAAANVASTETSPEKQSNATSTKQAGNATAREAVVSKGSNRSTSKMQSPSKAQKPSVISSTEKSGGVSSSKDRKQALDVGSESKSSSSSNELNALNADTNNEATKRKAFDGDKLKSSDVGLHGKRSKSKKLSASNAKKKKRKKYKKLLKLQKAGKITSEELKRKKKKEKLRKSTGKKKSKTKKMEGKTESSTKSNAKNSLDGRSQMTQRSTASSSRESSPSSSLSSSCLSSSSASSSSSKTPSKDSTSSVERRVASVTDEKPSRQKAKTSDKDIETSTNKQSAQKPSDFLSAQDCWEWSGKPTKRVSTKGKAKRVYYRAITRDDEVIEVGDCAVFISTGRPHLPYVGRIESLWAGWGDSMVVRVKWFYHPEETKGGKKLQQINRALYESPHTDENDVQTISHKCFVMSYTDYHMYCVRKSRKSSSLTSAACSTSSIVAQSMAATATKHDDDVYYLAGTYEPTMGLIKIENDVKLL